MEKRALHDIRLRFKVPGIWSILYHTKSEEFQIDPTSKDIRLQNCMIDSLVIITTIHKTDTITVIVACSGTPIAVDINGIIHLSNALTKVEERLSKLVCDCLRIRTSIGYQHENIPIHNGWIVTLWHFGADSLVRYAGEKFEATWEVAENVLVRVYTKNLKDKGTRIRLERQEYPNKTFANAVEEKLNAHY